MTAVPTYAKTTVDELIASAKVRLKITALNTDEADLFLKEYILEGVSEMATANDFIEKTSEPIEICNNRIELPCDFVTFDRGDIFTPPIIFTENGQPITGLYCTGFIITATSRPFVQDPFGNISCTPCNGFNAWCGPITATVQDGYLLFSSNVDATECIISYLGLNWDSEGVLKVLRSHKRPIVNHAMAQWCLEMGDRVRYAEYNRIWTQGKLAARGQANMLDAFKREQMYRIMNTLL